MNGFGLAGQLRKATQPLHTIAERSGVMHRLLQGRFDAALYCRLHRNLHALYEALEHALDRHANLPSVGPVRFPELYRTAALREDLRHLHGEDWTRLLIAPAMQAYVARIQQVSDSHPSLLVAHAYVRYMGDMSGGQILRDVVRRALDLSSGAGTMFYAFAPHVSVAAMKEQFRLAMDMLPLGEADVQAVVAEANKAFGLHVRLFEELNAM